ncbi:Fc.00g107370.m01.CDS01 [Cosmosporella sp. VM-42]
MVQCDEGINALCFLVVGSIILNLFLIAVVISMILRSKRIDEEQGANEELIIIKELRAMESRVEQQRASDDRRAIDERNADEERRAKQKRGTEELQRAEEQLRATERRRAEGQQRAKEQRRASEMRIAKEEQRASEWLRVHEKLSQIFNHLIAIKGNCEMTKDCCKTQIQLMYQLSMDMTRGRNSNERRQGISTDRTHVLSGDTNDAKAPSPLEADGDASDFLQTRSQEH